MASHLDESMEKPRGGPISPKIHRGPGTQKSRGVNDIWRSPPGDVVKTLPKNHWTLV